jgi:creatinine amidohydrolase
MLFASVALEETNGKKISELDLASATVVLPIGACENHGPHLPFSCDSIIPTQLAKRISQKRDGIILLPTIGYGESSDHMGFPMTISLSGGTLETMVFEILHCAASHGVRRFLIINGHDGNSGPIISAAHRLRTRHPGVVVANFEWWRVVYQHLDPELFAKWGGHGHAGESETSTIIYLTPELVNMELAPEDTPPVTIDGGAVYWAIDEYSHEGTEGAPRLAEKHKGIAVFEKSLELIDSFLKKMDQQNWRPVL